MDRVLLSGMREAKAPNCWSTIGVRGEKSCEALTRYAHCRNCPTYSEIAATLLTRAVIDEDRDDWEARYATPKHSGDHKDHSVLIFRLGTEWFAIDTGAFDEVVELRALHRLPHRNHPVMLGMTNVRGELVVCVSLDRLLGVSVDTGLGGKARRMLILRSDAGRLAVPVDEVQHTHSYRSDEVIVPPATSARATKSYTTGIIPYENRMVSCLDALQVIKALESCLG